MKELIRVRVQYASRQQCCKTHKRPLPFFLYCTPIVHSTGKCWSEDGLEKTETCSNAGVLLLNFDQIETFFFLRPFISLVCSHFNKRKDYTNRQDVNWIDLILIYRKSTQIIILRLRTRR